MPQDKEIILDDFLKSLRVAVNNITTYFSGHPLLLKSLQDLQSKIQSIFISYGSLKIAVSPKALFFNGKAIPASRLCTDLSQIFHLRKIKSFEIKPGVTLGEMEYFLSVLALNPKDISENSGVADMLKKKNISWIVVEDLDYSELLKEDGTQEVDPWQYLLKDILGGNRQSLGDFADKFTGLANRLNAKELSDNDKLRSNIKDFLTALKKSYPDKFKVCAKELVSAIIKDKNSLNQANLAKIRELLKDIDESDLSEVFLRQISSDEGFDHLSLDLFANLIDRDKHKNIADILNKNIDNPDWSRRYPKIKEKLRNLFSVSTNPFITEIYRNTLTVLSQPHDRQKLRSFDKEALREDYRYLLTTLLDQEKRKDRALLIAGKIFNELPASIEKKDTAFLNNLWNILVDKNNQGMLTDKGLSELTSHMTRVMEDLIINGDTPEALEDFLLMAGKSFYDVDFYFDLIFDKRKGSYAVLRIFIAFFASDINRFIMEIKRHESDVKLLEGIIENLKTIDSPMVLRIYKEILAIPSDFLKIAIVRALKNINSTEEEYLFKIMGSDNYLLKREIVGVLCLRPASRIKILNKLFGISNPFGMNNKVLLESLSIVSDLKIKEAEPYVGKLAGLKMFWYDELRRKAIDVLSVLKG
jgi:hypothetical protein